jgi:hypothetical protein
MMKWTFPDAGLDKVDVDLDFRLFYFTVKELFQKIAELQELLSWDGDSLSLYEEVERREMGEARWRKEKREEMREAMRGKVKTSSKGKESNYGGRESNLNNSVKEDSAFPSSSESSSRTESQSDSPSRYKADYAADFQDFSEHKSELQLLQQLKRASFLGCAAGQDLDFRCQWTCDPKQGCDPRIPADVKSDENSSSILNFEMSGMIQHRYR